MRCQPLGVLIKGGSPASAVGLHAYNTKIDECFFQVAPHFAYPFLPNSYLPLAGAQVPFPAYLLPLYGRRYTRMGAAEGRLAGPQAHFQMPPLGAPRL